MEGREGRDGKRNREEGIKRKVLDKEIGRSEKNKLRDQNNQG